MQYQKTIKIAIHYGTTKEKLDKLNKLTARITYAIWLISGLITEDTKLNRKTVRALVRNSDVVEKTVLSAGFVDQCIDKVLWSWKAYRKQHKKWARQVASAEKRDNPKWLAKLLKREPQKPSFENHKVPCRIDCRTGRIERSVKSKLTSLWMHVSTLKKNQPMDIPLNPSHYHLQQLQDAEINDFEIIKRGNKYYAHISITKEIEKSKVSSIGGVDQGLNHSAGIVLLPLDGSMPYEELICDAEKQALLQKYDDLIAELQGAEDWHKLRQLRHKRKNIAINFDWLIATEIAEKTKGAILGISDTDFRKTQYRGNEMPTLRKRIGKWSYARQRVFIALKRAENGDDTVLKNERGTSIECCECHSKMTRRKWLRNGSSYILCWFCGNKKDADINAAHNIAL
ncbi:MAG: transposase [Methanomicrobia archaeon]|nr:transposase [Methanomicrobia archaeon]